MARKKKNSGKDSNRKKRTSDVPIVELSGCKYEVLRQVLKKHGWDEAGENEKSWHLLWTDTSIGPEKLLQLKKGQKVNHFYGMLEICRKRSLARNLLTMRKMFPAQYKFFPRAFILPGQLPLLISSFNVPRVKTFILKPDNGCQGRGVVLVQSVADVKEAIQGMNGANFLAQKYLTNPMLLDGYKFDLRIYALMLSCDPLRLYLYREGIARFCTEKYMKPDSKNLRQACMHLTNYSVNKYNPKFEFNKSEGETDQGHKWSMSALLNALAIRGFDTAKLLRQISHIVVMTIIPIVPLLVHNSKTYLSEDEQGDSCFELLGLDVLLDDKCRPWLLEVNHSPSFSVDTPLDRSVKEALISDTLRLAHIDPSVILKVRLQEKKVSKMRLYGKPDNVPTRRSTPQEGSHTPSSQKQKKAKDFEAFESANKGKFERVYPPRDEKLQKLYSVLLAGSEEAFQRSFDMKNKEIISKVREDRRQEELERDEAERRKEKAILDAKRKAAQERARLVAQIPREELEYSRQRVNACLERLGMDGALAADLKGASKGELYKAVVRPLNQLVLQNTPVLSPRFPFLQPNSSCASSSNHSANLPQSAHIVGISIRGTGTSVTPDMEIDGRQRISFSKLLPKSQDLVPRVTEGFEPGHRPTRASLAPIVNKPHIHVKLEDIALLNKRGIKLKPEELAQKLEELEAMTRCEKIKPQDLGGTAPFAYKTEPLTQVKGPISKKELPVQVGPKTDDIGWSLGSRRRSPHSKCVLPKLEDSPDWRLAPMPLSTTIAEIFNSPCVQTRVAVAAAQSSAFGHDSHLHYFQAALAEAGAMLTASASKQSEPACFSQHGKRSPVPRTKTPWY